MIDILYLTNNTTFNLLLFVLAAAALIFSLVLHELGHGFAALKSGDNTAKINGRLSLNPVKHFDPIGFAMLIFIGFGYAKPVPVNVHNFKNRKRGMFFVSVAGVTINIILSFIFCAFYVISQNAFDKSGGMSAELCKLLFEYLVRLNLVLCFFNLLPLFPLDGFRILESFTRYDNKIMDFLRRYGMYILLGLVGVSLMLSYFPSDAPMLKYLDVLSLYINFFANNIMRGFEWFWRLIF